MINNNLWKFNRITRSLAEKFGDSNALSDDFISLTYNELDKECGILAVKLRMLGIKKGDIIMLGLTNSVYHPVILLALIRIGAIPLLLHTQLLHHEIEPLIKLCRPAAWIRDSHFSEEEADKYNYGGLVLTVGDLKNISVKPAPPVEAECSLKDTAFLLLSSGSTGTPKCIPKTYGELTVFFNCYIKEMGFTRETRSLVTGPLSHYLPFIIVFGTLLAGGTAFITRFFSPVDIISTVSENNINTAAMVPAMLRMCINCLDLSQERCVIGEKLIIGGSKMGKDDIQSAIKYFSCSVVLIYGSSEAIFCISRYNDKSDLDAFSEGTPMYKSDKIKISGSKTTGELLVKGPYVLKNYYGMESRKYDYFTSDGYYKTGDLAWIDKNGSVHICGRCTEMINRCGEKIIPYELEEMIKKHRNIAECAVCGVKDITFGEKIVVFAELKAKDLSYELKDLKINLSEQGIAEYKLPDELVLMERLPKNASGKVQKKILIENYSNGIVS